MPVILRPVTASETDTIVAMLQDAEEGEARIRAAVLDADNASYAAFDGNTMVGAATLRWEEHESEIIYRSLPSSSRNFRPCLRIFSRSLRIPSMSCSGRGGQPGT
jgi:hypothetical protein